MKLVSVSKGLFLGLALLLATSAFASNKGPLQLTDYAVVSGKQLTAGDYTVKWEGNGPTVEVSIMKGKAIVATTSAKLVDLGHSYDSDSAVLNKNADGSNSLAEIRFSGKKYALAINQMSPQPEQGDSMK